MAKTLDQLIDQLIALREEAKQRDRVWSPPVWVEDDSGYREIGDVRLGGLDTNIYIEVGRRDLRTKR